MVTNNFRLALAVAAGLALAPAFANATISKAVQFDQKVEKAATIVLGRCVAQESRWDDARKWILTYSTFEVEKTLKGTPAQQVTIVTPGGTVDNIAQNVIGVPRFRQGDEHVVFVRNTSSGPTVLYFDQGAYRVTKDARGDRIVQPLVSSEVLVDTQRGMAVAPEASRSLREFEDRVQRSIRNREILRMEMIEKKKREEASLRSTMHRNRLLIALAILGAALATWQLMRRL